MISSLHFDDKARMRVITCEHINGDDDHSEVISTFIIVYSSTPGEFKKHKNTLSEVQFEISVVSTFRSVVEHEIDAV